ncbi:hypothetical protein E2C01_100419 [Portunus trituberculatus]|uniref:Uncharacterized protein n=1 Tax=Portunus trituberculatus TaxID=210409 RepID=A0A5B7KDA5_PORTR|nr:hypothetical protein [Portunus trituberculatus]
MNDALPHPRPTSTPSPTQTQLNCFPKPLKSYSPSNTSTTSVSKLSMNAIANATFSPPLLLLCLPRHKNTWTAAAERPDEAAVSTRKGEGHAADYLRGYKHYGASFAFLMPSFL